MTDTDMLYMSSQAKRITNLENENRELKRLLKEAVGHLNYAKVCETCAYDDNCPIYEDACQYKWRYADEAMMLIGGAVNENNK